MKAFNKILHPHGKHGHREGVTRDESYDRHDSTYAPAATASGLGTSSAMNTTTTTTTTALPMSDVEVASPRTAQAEMTAEVIERTESAPIIHKHIIPVEREEVVPVIEREREVAEIQPIIRPITEHLEAPVRDVSRELPEERREYRGEMSAADTRKLSEFSSQYAPGVTTTDIAPVIHEGTRVAQPIVHEVIRPHIIEQVTPVIESEVVQPTVIHTRKPIYEHIVEAPVVREPRFESPVARSEWDRSHHYMPAASAASSTGFAASGAPGPRTGMAEGELASHSMASELNTSRVPGSSTPSSFNASGAPLTGQHQHHHQHEQSYAPGASGVSGVGGGSSYAASSNPSGFGHHSGLGGAGVDAALAKDRVLGDASRARDNAMTDANLARNNATSDANLNRPLY